MKWLSAGLTFVNVATFCALFLGIVGNGLGFASTSVCFALGLIAAAAAFLGTFDAKAPAAAATDSRTRYGSVWLWIMAAFFTIFAVRAFCWILYRDGADYHIQSTNNLGDLALHVTYMRDFANGSPLWPLNPIFPIGKLRYPAGTDLFNGLLLILHADLVRGLVWAGLAGSLATFYALYRWGGSFTVAGFLFNGGVVGFRLLDDLWYNHSIAFSDFQGDKAIAWKSIPLSMFVTQRGLLYAIPAGLILLWHWREKFYRRAPGKPGPLPFAVEALLYATLPLFHVHTFLALSLVLVCLFVGGDMPMRQYLLTLFAAAIVPATFCAWIITDHFNAGSVLKSNPGWLLGSQMDHNDPLYHPFFEFWWINFGIWMPLILVLFAVCVWRGWKEGFRTGPSAAGARPSWSDWKKWVLYPEKLREDLAFLIPAAVIFLAGMFWKFAPWEWDNLKIMFWGYFIILPYLWKDLLAKWDLAVRVAICFALFGSGFVSLFGGLSVNGYGFANRAEVAGVGLAVRPLPLEARFAAFPTYNHPLLLQGRNLILGYGGHLWTQGFDYGEIERRLKSAMNGEGDWRRTLQGLGARYLFWGREEKLNYPASLKPWEKLGPPLMAGDWGAIYDLGEPTPSAKP